MDRSNVLILHKQTYSKDAIGQYTPVISTSQVFCNLRSVSRSEWASAGQLGLKPELVATMFAWDYHGEEIAEIVTPMASVEASYLQSESGQLLSSSQGALLMSEGGGANGTPIKYGVYRTYLLDNEQIELYLERKTGVTNG